MKGILKPLAVAAAVAASGISTPVLSATGSPEIENEVYKLWSGCRIENRKSREDLGKGKRYLTHKGHALNLHHWDSRTSGDGARRQRFTIIYLKDLGHYKLYDAWSNHCMATSNTSDNVESRDCDDNGQYSTWDISNAGSGYRYLRMPGKNKNLGLTRGRTNRGTLAKVGTINGARDQQWLISCKNDGANHNY